jgi:hypothetical protein
VSHRIIIIDSVTPPPAGAAAAATTTDTPPEFEVHITYRPPDSMTSSQIGNEVARVQKLVNKIIEGTPN